MVTVEHVDKDKLTTFNFENPTALTLFDANSGAAKSNYIRKAPDLHSSDWICLRESGSTVLSLRLHGCCDSGQHLMIGYDQQVSSMR
ncbi:hypothetical protein ACOSQ3_007738 [Xanthoceras sorbifolium]